MYYISRFVGAVAFVACLVLGWFSVRLAQADAWFRRATPEAVARAVAMMPRNTDYAAFQALQLAYDGQDAVPVLERIAKQNPLSSAPRIRLGLAAEIRGDIDAAEKWLLDAARVDHQFEPGWTLANFYFRRGRRDEFWKWIHRALEVSYGDRKLAFDLCWRISDDSQEILSRAIPDLRDVLAAYFFYLHDGNPRRLAASVPVALKLAALKNSFDLPLVYGACQSFLAERQEVAALELWRISGHVPPSGIMNGDFTHAPSNFCFDWERQDAPGIHHIFLDQRIRIEMSGQQAETSHLLGQYIRLQPDKRYVLRGESRTQGIRVPSGITWSMDEASSAAMIPSDDWRAAEYKFAPRSRPDP